MYNNIPVHVGIIMDGNGRWAKNKGLMRFQGHQEGLKTAKKIVKKASELGVKYLSLYTFSTENWKRAENEVSFLMSLIRSNLRKEYKFYEENKIQVIHSGDASKLPKGVLEDLNFVYEKTKNFDNLVLNLAINYGGRDAIIRAVNKMLEKKIDSIDEKDFSSYFDRPEIPAMDLLIRTSGEKRISNFMLWEMAYSEMFFSDTLWPDFTEQEFEEIYKDFLRRDRRFGGVFNA